RTLCLNPAAYWAIANGLTPSFVMPTAKEALVKGYLATIGNYEVYMDQNVPQLPGSQHATSVGFITNSTAAGVQGSSNTVGFYGGTAADKIRIGEELNV